MCTGSQFLPNRVLTACYSLGTFHCTDMLLWICCPGSCHWILWWTLLQTWLNNVLVDRLSLVLIIRFSLVGVEVALVDCLANRCVKPCNSVAKLSLSWTFFMQVQQILYRVKSTSLIPVNTVEPRYNEVIGTMKITLLYQVSHYIRVQKQRNIKSWDQQNYLVIRGFCSIRPLYNEVPLYFKLLCQWFFDACILSHGH